MFLVTRTLYNYKVTFFISSNDFCITLHGQILYSHKTFFIASLKPFSIISVPSYVIK